MTRPRGMPPTPSARSNPSEPVEVASIASSRLSPSFMMEPLPKFFSICDSAVSSALFLSMDPPDESIFLVEKTNTAAAQRIAKNALRRRLQQRMDQQIQHHAV